MARNRTYHTPDIDDPAVASPSRVFIAGTPTFSSQDHGLFVCDEYYPLTSAIGTRTVTTSNPGGSAGARIGLTKA